MTNPNRDLPPPHDASARRPPARTPGPIRPHGAEPNAPCEVPVRARVEATTFEEGLDWRRLAIRLLCMHTQGVHLRWGYESVERFSEEHLGIDRRAAREALRVAVTLVASPEVDRAFRAGWFGWEKLRVIARVAVPGTHAAWIERAIALDLPALLRLAASSTNGVPPRASGVGEEARGIGDGGRAASVPFSAPRHAARAIGSTPPPARLGRERSGRRCPKGAAVELRSEPATKESAVMGSRTAPPMCSIGAPNVRREPPFAGPAP